MAFAAKLSKGKDTKQAQKHPAEVVRQPVPTGLYGAVLALQRSAGNRAVNHLLGQGLRTLPSTSGLLQRKCACGNKTMAGGKCEECGKKQRLGLQTKLKVNEPGDVYEQEADRIADQVMATQARYVVNDAPPRFQRFSGQSNGRLDEAPASVDRALASPSRPLEPALRQDMEQRFGYDFSQVRVHTGAVSERSARAIRARAYTVGFHIVLGPEVSSLHSTEGRHMLAHELVHVVQQDRSASPTSSKLGSAGGGPEQGADQVASKIAVGSSAARLSAGTTSGLLQRQGTAQAPVAEPEEEIAEGAEPDPSIGGPRPRLYPMGNSPSEIYERSQAYGAKIRAQQQYRKPFPVLKGGGAPPLFVTKRDRQHKVVESGFEVSVDVYEFHVLDALEYEIARAGNDKIPFVLYSYMPDEFAPPPNVKMLPLLDPEIMKMIDPGAKERVAVALKALEKRRRREEAKVLAEAENVALKGKKRMEGPCNKQPNPPKGGNDEHNKYASHVAMVKGYGPVSGELTWTTPEGVSYSFDTFNPKNELEVWEVKTQHEWASPLGMARAPYIPNFSERIVGLEVQRLTGLYVADRCGLRFKYAFDNCKAYRGFRQQWPLPPLEYIPYPGEPKVDCP